MMSRYFGNGITRAWACIQLRIPESGDDELDALIRKAQWRDVAAQIANLYANSPSRIDAVHAVKQADALLKALEDE
jgi:hypothetical protein